MNPITRHCVWFPALLASAVALAQSAPMQSIEELRQQAESFLVNSLRSTAVGDATPHAHAAALDQRLRLPRCTAALQGSLPATMQVTARITIGMRCASPAWTVYVPMTVETELNVLVMRTAAARGSSPTAEDVELQRRRVPGIATAYLTSLDQLRGRHLMLPVSPGTALSVDLLAADILIKRGQRVTLVASLNGIEVRALGEAIADATAAGRVRVQNLSSRKIVEGQVESADRVRINL